MDKVNIDLKEYFVGQGGGYGGQPGGSIAATGWAGTYSSPQTSNRLNLHPDTGITSYMQGNTIVRNALPDTILPQDLEGTPYDPDEIRLGLRSEMKKQEFPDKTKAKDVVLQNLAKNPKFYSDLLQYINSDKGNIMENIDPKELEMGKRIEHEHTKDDALATKIALDHLREDPHYYTKLKKAGLEDDGSIGPVAPSIVVLKIDSPVDDQKKLTSSGLGSPTEQEPLKSTDLKAPSEKNKIGPNSIAVSKTPLLSSAASCDPIDHFGSQMVEKW